MPLRTATLIALALSLLVGCGDSGVVAQTGPQEESFTAAELVDTYERATVFVTSSQGSGSGIVVDEQGHILTNNHVVSGAAAPEIRDPASDTMINTSVIATDPCDDLAVIRPTREVESLRPAPLGSTDNLKLGTTVFTVGYPGTPDQDFDHLELAVTRGVVSRISENFRSPFFGLREAIQIDAPLNPGNSGGPLVNGETGKVVGINTLGYFGLQDVNFAVTIDRAREVLPDLKDGRDVNSIGLKLEPNRGQYETLGVPLICHDDACQNTLATLVVLGVKTTSPLHLAGFRRWDLVHRIAGHPPTNDDGRASLRAACDILRSHRGQRISIEGLRVRHDGSRTPVRGTIEVR